MNNSSFGTEENFEDVETWLRVLNSVLLSLFLFFSIIGNGAVILLVIIHKNLHYRSIVVSLGLVAADLMVALQWNFLGLTSTIAGEWIFSDVGCKALGTVLICVLEIRWLEVAVVTLDRFFIILSPFNYYKYSKPLQVVLTVLAWLVPVIVISTPAALDFGTYRFRLIYATCFIDCLGDGACYAFYFGGFGIFMLVGSVLPTVLYSVMYCIGRNKRFSMEHTLGTQIVEAENFSSNSSTETTFVHQSNLASQTNSVRLKAQDRRALVTFFITFITLLVTQIPIFITGGALRNTDIFDDIPLWIHFISMYIFLLSPVLTPIVIMKNKDFRRVISSLIKRNTSMPLVTNTQIQQFRRNSSLGISVCSINGSQTDIHVCSSRKYSIPNQTGVKTIKTIIEEDLQGSS